jgi:hypothetical protein
MQGANLEAMPDASTSNESDTTVEPDSFDAFVRPHLDAPLRVAVSLSHNFAAAKDRMQDTLLRAFKSIATFNEPYPQARLFANPLPTEPLRRLHTLATDLASGSSSGCTPSP